MDVFVYGTLTDPERVAQVVEEFSFGPDAVLSGLRRVDGEYPTLAPGGRTDGRILSTPCADALDAYEGVDRGLYVRCSVPRADGGETAVYVGKPDRLGVREVSWPGTGDFRERIRRYVARNDVSVGIR